jgi:hypothetical protein
MMKSAFGPLFAMCSWMLLAPECQAQYPGQPPGGRFGGGAGGQLGRPAVSPYLNLLNSGDTAINYYGLVRPQFAYNRAIQNLGNEINYLEANPAGNQMLQQSFQTGTRATFMTQSKYFMNNGYGAGYRSPGMAGPGAGQTSSPARPR